MSCRYCDAEGVTIRPHNFGGLSGVASLDPADPKLTATYHPLIESLKAMGYTERETLWGAPYDWRLAGDGLAQRGVADDMQSLIEEAKSAAGGERVVLVAHSMGNLVLSHFFGLWGRAWVLEHVRHVVAVSAPFGGSVDALKGPISGDNFDLKFPRSLLHPVQGVSPSAAWCVASRASARRGPAVCERSTVKSGCSAAPRPDLNFALRRLFPSAHLWSADEVLVRFQGDCMCPGKAARGTLDGCAWRRLATRVPANAGANSHEAIHRA